VCARSASGAAFGVALGLFALACPPLLPTARPIGAPPREGAARLLWGLPLDLNRASEGDLQVLPGIGPARARAIVGARPFCRASELLRVPGIGPVTFERVAERVFLSAPLGRCRH
jgi:hypothetical protein